MSKLDTFCNLTVVFAVLFAANFGLKEIYESDKNSVNLFRSSTHLQESMIIAIGLRECGLYPVDPFVKRYKTAKNLGNWGSVSELGLVNCNSTRFSSAVDMGHSWLLAASIFMGNGKPIDMATTLFICKILAVIFIYIMLRLACGKVHALITLIVLSIVVVLLQSQMFRSQLIMVNHNYTWLVYLLGILMSGISSYRKEVSHFFIVFAVVLISYISILRINDFYLLILSVMVTAFIVLAREKMWSFNFKGLSLKNVLSLKQSRQFIVSTILVGGAVAGHMLHETYVDSKAGGARIVNNHSVIHPIILGLGRPETPFSRRHNYKWLSDTETLKVAQSLNPNVKKMYSDEFNKTLTTLYINTWISDPSIMLHSYYIKAVSILGGKVWIYFVLISCMAVFLYLREYIGLLLSVATIGKVVETVVIFPTPYTPLFHQYIPALLSVLLIFVFMAIVKVIGTILQKKVGLRVMMGFSLPKR